MNKKARGASVALAGSRSTGQSSWFIPVSGTVLALTGIAKLWTVSGNVKILEVTDPIAGLPFRWLLLGVGVLELVTAGVCLIGKNRRLATMFVAWISTNFVAYRLGLWWLDWHRPCSCLGNLTDALRISPQAADNIMKVVLAYLLIGSYTLLFLNWRQNRAVTEGIQTGSNNQ